MPRLPRKPAPEWIIVNIHKGPYTTSNHATDDDIIGENGVRSMIAPLMAELDIDFVLQGHDHIYARTKPIAADGTAAEQEKITESLNGKDIEYTVNPDGTIYLIPATAGPKVYYKNDSELLGDAYYDLFELAEENHAAKYGPDPSDSSRPKRGQVQNFVGITIDGNELTAVTYEIDQNIDNAEPFIVDQFGIVKQSDNGTDPDDDSDDDSDNGSGNGSGSGSGNGSGNGGNGGSGSGSPSGGIGAAVSMKDIADHWAQSAIENAMKAGFVNGYADGTFRPDNNVTRAEFITMLGRALGVQASSASLSFRDEGQIPAWAGSFISQAVDSGIINGYADNTFGPNKPLTRAELVAIIVRASGVSAPSGATLTFNDASQVPAWAVPYVAAATEAGLIGGVGNNRFAPQQTATRAEAVTLITNLLNKFPYLKNQ